MNIFPISFLFINILANKKYKSNKSFLCLKNKGKKRTEKPYKNKNIY